MTPANHGRAPETAANSPPETAAEPLSLGESLLAEARRLPRALPPMLAVDGGEPFDSASHIFEVMWDGVRALAFLEDGAVRLQDGYLRDVTFRYPDLQGMAKAVGEKGVVLDGVIVALDGEGRPQLALLQERLFAKGEGEARRAAARNPVVYQAFDVLYCDGRPLLNHPLRRRKDVLHQLIRPDAALRAPDFVVGEGLVFFSAVREHELAGMIAKERESVYRPGERSRAWQRLKVYEQGEFVIGGYTFGGRARLGARAAREPLASLLLGLYREEGSLTYVGEVAGGFTEEVTRRSVVALDALHSSECPFSPPPSLPRLIFWCRPELVCRVRFGGWHGGRLQFPLFEGLRPDVPARGCSLAAWRKE